ncbi:MAG TPA: hypothetical protein VMU51_31130 [Mycobacteriales bacterium]|nr:hypothetical protein [Mycobacteriales bacterium]
MFTIAGAAAGIVGSFGWDYDDALTFATDFARHRGVQTGTEEGGQAPRVEIDEQTWRAIWEDAAVASETTQF